MKILGNGIDIIEIERISAALERRPQLIFRMFTQTEQQYFKTRKYSPSTIAGCFAAKEAVVKALGTGFSGINPYDVEISWNERGKPSAHVSKYSNITFMTSISHSKKYAVANVIAIEEE